jgi:hypothetical protein
MAEQTPFPKLIRRLRAGAVPVRSGRERYVLDVPEPTLTEAQMIALGTPAAGADVPPRGGGSEHRG